MVRTPLPLRSEDRSQIGRHGFPIQHLGRSRGIGNQLCRIARTTRFKPDLDISTSHLSGGFNDLENRRTDSRPEIYEF